MIGFIIDAILLIAVSTVAWIRDPFLGVLFLGMSVSYASQYWRMIHLLGFEERRPERRRVIMAALLALIFGGGVFLLLGARVPAAMETSLSKLWQDDFVPIWIGMGFFASLSLIYLTNERKKR